MEKEYVVKRYDMVPWYEKAVLSFVPLRTHESEEGFVIYKTLLSRFYVIFSAHYTTQAPYDGGHSSPWRN